jgi:hypothetical protein
MTKEHAIPTQCTQINLLEENTHEEGDEMRATNVGAFVARVHRTKQTEKEKEKQRNTKPCVRQSTEKEKRKNRLKSTTIKSVNATGRPTPCGQTPEKK